MATKEECSFQAAVNVVRSMPKKGSFQPSHDMMLKFYGLYKQATLGECKDPKPGFWDVVGKAKWDAWSALGSMTSKDAMEKYVTELKQVIETMPQTAEVAEFTQVLKSFYEAAYNESQEHIPAVYEIFRKKKLPCKDGVMRNTANGHELPVESSIKSQHKLPKGKPKENGHVPPLDVKEVENGPKMNGDLKNGDINHHNMNGGKGGVIVNGTGADHYHQTQYVVEYCKDKKKEQFRMNGNGCDNEESKRVTFEEVATDLVIDTLESQSVENDLDGKDIDLNNGLSSSCTSEESDEEFCDSLDPEHMVKPENQTLSGASPASPDGSPSNGSSTNSTFTESDISENDINGSRLFTSTPHASKRALHVKFALENEAASDGKENSLVSEPDVVPAAANEGLCYEPVNVNSVTVTKGEASSGLLDEPLNNELTGRSSAGILKPYEAGSGYGGGDSASVQPSGRPSRGSYRQRQYSSVAGKNGRGVTTSQVGCGYHRHSDSDSDDDHPTGDDYDSTGTEREDGNERVLLALERLQQDMNSVLRRLGSVEEAVIQKREFKKPWWWHYLPSRTMIFCVVWPVMVNLAFRYFRKRREQREMLERGKFLQMQHR